VVISPFLKVIGVIMMISLLMMWRYQPPRKDEAALLYQRFVKKTGIEPNTGETARVFALRARESGKIAAATIDQVTEAYLDARYGAADEDANERLRAAVAAMP